VRPAGLRVLGAPAAGWAVAGFALDAIFDVHFAGDHPRGDVRGVAIEANGFLIRLSLEAHVAGHARGAVAEEDVVGLCVAIFAQPRVVLVLQDVRGVERLSRAVAAGVGAGGDAVVVAGNGGWGLRLLGCWVAGLLRRGNDSGYQQKGNHYSFHRHHLVTGFVVGVSLTV